MRKTILHLCADTGSDTWPYAQDSDNYEVIKIGRKIGVENYSPDRPIHGIIANPVCTDFSQARRGHSEPSNHARGMEMVNECLRIIEEANPVWYALENPSTGALRRYLGEPRFTYQPWHYGSPWSKPTALWGRFNIPPRIYDYWEQVPERVNLWIRPGRDKPSLVGQHVNDFYRIPEYRDSGLPFPHSDAELRSFCSQKFAAAFKAVNP